MRPAEPLNAERTGGSLFARLGPLCVAMFLGFLTVSVPLPSLPLHVTHDLGFGTFAAGLAVGLQSIATLLTRPASGRMVDALGARRTLLRGHAVCSAAGWIYILAPPMLPLHGRRSRCCSAAAPFSASGRAYSSPAWSALGTGVTGAGCSLVFPSLGIEALRRVADESRRITIGAFAGFQDMAIGLTGPVLGTVAAAGRPSSVFLVGAVLALAGASLSLRLGERGDERRPAANLQK